MMYGDTHNKEETNSMASKTPCKVVIYDDGLGECKDAAAMIASARELLHSSEETVDNKILLAKASQESCALCFYVDRDNFEFLLKKPGSQKHIAGGNLASELKGISIPALRQIMSSYMVTGHRQKLRKALRQA